MSLDTTRECHYWSSLGLAHSIEFKTVLHGAIDFLGFIIHAKVIHQAI